MFVFSSYPMCLNILYSQHNKELHQVPGKSWVHLPKMYLFAPLRKVWVDTKEKVSKCCDIYLLNFISSNLSSLNMIYVDEDLNAVLVTLPGINRRTYSLCRLLKQANYQKNNKGHELSILSDGPYSHLF